jgi:hypothetical protein
MRQEDSGLHLLGRLGTQKSSRYGEYDDFRGAEM